MREADAHHEPPKPKPTFLEVFMVNSLGVYVAKTCIYHGFAGSWQMFAECYT